MGTSDLSNPYVHSITLFLIKQTFEEKIMVRLLFLTDIPDLGCSNSNLKFENEQFSFCFF